MPWLQTAPGRFQREIGENEVFIKIIGDSGHPLGHEHWAINADASFSQLGEMSVDQLMERFKNAWKNLRFQHPSIASVANETQLEYVVPDDHALQQWLSKTFIIEKASTLADVAANLPATPYASLYVFPTTSEVLLHTSHWRTDGIGVLQLMNAFFDLAGSDNVMNAGTLPWGQETSRLAPSIEEAANIPPKPDARIHTEAAKWTKSFHEVVDAVGIECDADKNTLPGGTRFTRSSFSEVTTESIVQACKSRQISVTSAVHAALASTNWLLAASEERSKHYTSTIRVALRPYLPDPYCTPAYASGLYTTGYMHSLPAGQSFGHNAQQINQLYRRGLTSDFLQAHRQYALNLQDLIRNTPPDSPSPNSVDISSVGLLDNIVGVKHGHLEITSIHLGVELLTRQMTCFVWTFKGKLGMNLVYNESFYDSQTPNKFLEKLMETLVKELGIQR